MLYSEQILGVHGILHSTDLTGHVKLRFNETLIGSGPNLWNLDVSQILVPIPYIWGFCTLPTFLLKPGVTQRQLADSNSSE